MTKTTTHANIPAAAIGAPSALVRTLVSALALCILLAVAASLLGAPTAAMAQARDDMNACLCRGVLARTLCKKPEEFNFIDEYRDTGTYAFTVFYANDETRFLCMVTPTEIRIKGRAWQKIMRTVPFDMDQETLCAVADYSTIECPQKTPLFCCGEKTDAEVSDDKAYDFWSRPIPEILEEELGRDMTEPAPPEQPAQ